MDGFTDNSGCVLAYLELFQALAEKDVDCERCRSLWEIILEREAQTQQETLLAPPVMRRLFSLPERDFLLVMAALAMEMDGALRGEFRRRYGLERPTLEYGLQLLEPICLNGVETVAGLARRGYLLDLLLVPAKTDGYLMERPLILCRAAVAFLTGLSFAEVPGVAPMPYRGEDFYVSLHKEALEQIQGWYASEANTVLRVCGPEGSGRRTLVCRACYGAVCVDLSETGARQDLSFREAVVTAILMPAPVCALRSAAAPEGARALERLCHRSGVSFAVLADDENSLTEVQETVWLPKSLTREERRAMWSHLLPDGNLDACPDGAVTARALREIAALAYRRANSEGRNQVTAEDTRVALRRRSGAVGNAVRHEAPVSLNDMVLPSGVLEQLEAVCQAAQHGGELAAWGLPQDREGVTAVFHGPSGTGKTMAASAIASRLGLPLLRADLSQIMDKYVGETEKRLAILLQNARENRCVLLFDEADALFGKRTELSSSHDKYANLSTSYLLQEIERYEGVALLSTNHLSSFDEAFLRRLHFIVRFPLPDASLRETLWRRALPSERLEGDIPYQLLAQAELSPARIDAAARNAAVWALAQGREQVDAIGMVWALRFELEKSGKTLPRGLAERFKEGVERYG